MEEFQPDWIVAMGGGSPIDAAKAMWIKYEYPDITFEEMCKVFGMPKLRKKAHFCAISSQNIGGTATMKKDPLAVTCVAIVICRDYETPVSNRGPLADFLPIRRDVAIVDQRMAKRCRKKLVAHTGMETRTVMIKQAACNRGIRFSHRELQTTSNIDPLALYESR